MQVESRWCLRQVVFCNGVVRESQTNRVRRMAVRSVVLETQKGLCAEVACLIMPPNGPAAGEQQPAAAQVLGPVPGSPAGACL